jgi:DNA polymerase III subunit epsilon
MALRPIYYDTETTGLNSEKDRIIEIAAFDPVRNKSFSQLINPKMIISEESISICNITNEMVKDALTFEEVGKMFIEFCSSDFVLIAHNNDSFDRPFLEAEYKRANLLMPKWYYLDSLKWARKYRPDLPKHALQYLRQIYNIEENQAHRALNDVIILHQVFEKMIDDLPIETIYKLLYKPSNESLEFMPFGKYQGKKLNQIPKSYIKWLEESAVFEKHENKSLKESFEKLGLLSKG